jgi:hypothetical protein
MSNRFEDIENKDKSEIGKIETVPLAKIPPANGARYYSLYQEVALRLETTSSHLALRVPIENPKMLDSVRISLRKFFKDAIPPVVILKREGALFIHTDAKPRARLGRPPRENGRGVEERFEAMSVEQD